MKVGATFLACVLLPLAARSDCTLTNTAQIPLPEMGYQAYQGFEGGQYPSHANQPPAPHLAAGLDISENQIKPLDGLGNVDTNNGKIVLLSIGMSNTTQEWASKGTENFRALANADPAKNPQVLIVDGAQGGKPSTDWTNFSSLTWSNVELRLAAAGASTNQVQVIWMKQARSHPALSGAFPAHAQALADDLEMILRISRERYPNLKIAYLSNRTRSYETNSTSLNPEPYAYECGFAVKWVIGKQINGASSLNFNPATGAVAAPWLAWGPYLWADGTTQRSDGFSWLCSDLETDYTHPSATGGVPKVGRQLLAFFKTDPTASPWFLRKGVIGQRPSVNASADVTSGVAPLMVHFSAAATDPDGVIRDYQWTFDDGTFATTANPSKVFKSPGEYIARVTVTDDSGNAVERSVPITVAATALESAQLVGGGLQFSVLGASNYDYIVQQSQNLVDWIPVATNHGPFVFKDSNSVAPARFFRAQLAP